MNYYLQLIQYFYFFMELGSNNFGSTQILNHKILYFSINNFAYFLLDIPHIFIKLIV